MDEESEEMSTAGVVRRSRFDIPKLPPAEQHRLAEVLLYNYFNQRDESNFASASFWEAIRHICTLYGVDSLCVSKTIRILMVDTCRPTDLETYYLLDKIMLSVRQIKNISGIYWQKQKKLKAEIERIGAPKCTPKVTDPALRKGMKDFLFAMYGIVGIFQFTDAKTLQTALS